MKIWKRKRRTSGAGMTRILMVDATSLIRDAEDINRTYAYKVGAQKAAPHICDRCPARGCAR